MIYSDVPAGAIVFVDAGPFIHHFEPNPIFGPASTDFLNASRTRKSARCRLRISSARWRIG
jgi:hypothetical protein